MEGLRGMQRGQSGRGMVMTARDRARTLPEDVQILIKAHMTKMSLGDQNPDLEAYCARALEWWDEVRKDLGEVGWDERTAARKMIDRLRTTPVWGKILRSQAN